MVCPVCGEKETRSPCGRCGTDLDALLGDSRRARLEVVRVERARGATRT